MDTRGKGHQRTHCRVIPCLCSRQDHGISEFTGNPGRTKSHDCIMTLLTDYSNKMAYHNSKISPNPPNSQSEHQSSQVGKVNSKHRNKIYSHRKHLTTYSPKFHDPLKHDSAPLQI